MNKEVSLEQLLKEHKISQRTFDKVTVAKNYIERRYNLKTIKNLEWNEIINRIDSLGICDKENQNLKNDARNSSRAITKRTYNISKNI